MSKATRTQDLEGLLRWMEPTEFLSTCLSREEVRDHILDKDGDAELLSEVLTTVFEEEYLPEMLDRFEESNQRLAEWLLEHGRAEITERGHPLKKLKWKEGNPKLKYRWLCKDCGTSKGIHYYPIQYCRTCNGQNLVRQVTKDSLGYTYRQERVITQVE